MRRAWILLLALSLGLNAALLYVTLTGRVPGREASTADAPCARPREMLNRYTEEYTRMRGQWDPIQRPGPGPGPGPGPRRGSRGDRERGPERPLGGDPNGGPGSSPGYRPGSAREIGSDGRPLPAFSDSLRDFRMHFLDERLNLRPDQQADLKAVLEETMPAILESRAELNRIRRQIFDEIQEPEIEQDRVRALVAELGHTQSRLDSLVAETILKEARHLDEDQRKAYFRAMPWHVGSSPPRPPGRRWNRHP